MQITKDLRHMDDFDPITNFPNRTSIEKIMADVVQNAEAAGEEVAVLYLDVDNFKIFNNVFGYQVGDRLLKALGERLKQHLRKVDHIARLGGDEFIFILVNQDAEDYASHIAKSILKALEEPIKVDDESIYINASIGISTFSKSATKAPDLFRFAEIAMYAAKAKGSNHFKHYRPPSDGVSIRQLHMLKGFKNALEQNELFILYQPIVDLKTKRYVAIEALVRWNHPVLGLLNPDEFLLFAESVGIMRQMNDWLIRQVLKDFKSLKPNQLSFVSINLRAEDLTNPRTWEHFAKALEEFSVDASEIIFELNERSFVRDPEKFIDKISKVYQSKTKLAIDDYGSGYSSLGYFKYLPISILKMDKAFVEYVPDEKTDCVILKSTVDLAHELGFDIVAEGVEKEEQVKFLNEIGCNYAQGFYYSKPITITELKALLQSS